MHFYIHVKILIPGKTYTWLCGKQSEWFPLKLPFSIFQLPLTSVNSYFILASCNSYKNCCTFQVWYHLSRHSRKTTYTYLEAWFLYFSKIHSFIM